jgi:hypothetical protein
MRGAKKTGLIYGTPHDKLSKALSPSWGFPSPKRIPDPTTLAGR